MITQLTFTIFVICIDFYRNAIGSALVLFVPAQCGNHPCNPIENLINGDKIYLSGASLNIIALICFCILGIIEFKRENWLNHYLIVNTELPIHSDTFSVRFNKLTDVRKQKLIFINTLYQRWAFFTLFIYLLNISFSSYIIFNNYLDNKTPISLVTNVMLLGHKFYDIYIIVSSKDVFISAYKNRHVEFNDVNPEKIQILEV